VTEQDSSATGDEDEESFQLFTLATSILREFQAADSLSTLDTAIYLFREVLDLRPTPHPMRSNSLKDVAGALFTRFTLSNETDYLYQAIEMWSEEAEGQFQLSVRVWSVFRS
jgi:hypothetical protein